MSPVDDIGRSLEVSVRGKPWVQLPDRDVKWLFRIFADRVDVTGPDLQRWIAELRAGKELPSLGASGTVRYRLRRG